MFGTSRIILKENLKETMFKSNLFLTSNTFQNTVECINYLDCGIGIWRDYIKIIVPV